MGEDAHLGADVTSEEAHDVKSLRMERGRTRAVDAGLA
jgi:hypothetical protein